ncbi:MurR/RpiR family transcriptional regulator [Pelagibacterium lentulum]|uniref:RpiR family transcriptional regulator n=1 Tax=Pelagibacterium lentulum TaxID=2029865 RepID=A0A916RC53_9HYPH|nr:MurR/RpiR family transcriptional regulator [Pelagibacterium lentulum]GGA49628.1 RpiR family transcriptional regulator [Pelagibacterium lentulum]
MTIQAEPDRRVDIIARLKARLGHGHGAETRLIETILEDLHFATHASMTEIARRAEVSEPTVTRLARALGFQTTREMKVHMAQALAIGGAYLRPGGSVGPGQHHDGNEIISAVCGRAHAALDLISVALASIDIAALGKTLAEAQQILIYGTGGSSSMAATELHNRLFRLGLNSCAYADPQLQRMSASVVTDRSVIVAFSISGRIRSVTDAVVIGKQYGAHTLAITVPGSPLAEMVDDFVPFHFQEDGNLYKPSSSRYALLAVLDILAMSTAETLGPPVLERLRRVRQSLATTEITDPLHPIGD